MAALDSKNSSMPVRPCSASQPDRPKADEAPSTTSRSMPGAFARRPRQAARHSRRAGSSSTKAANAAWAAAGR